MIFFEVSRVQFDDHIIIRAAEDKRDSTVYPVNQDKFMDWCLHATIIKAALAILIPHTSEREHHLSHICIRKRGNAHFCMCS